ncbi:MAG: hypothetical protein KF832_00650 [Caldilineaceae bacterium]|nr:hypothetical protein [Caldilineaceae bacterium]
MEIIQTDYQAKYDPNTATVLCSGSFRLNGAEYDAILGMLNAAAAAGHPVLTLDVSGLQFLNSSGINTLSKFVMQMRKQPASQLIVKGSEQYPWQKKSLVNLQRLLPNLRLEF